VVDPITFNGSNLAPLAPTLNISANLQGVGTGNTGSITKTGNGLLQLSSTTSAFSGGLNLNAGGLAVGASSTPSTVGSTVTSGPLGTGTLTIAGGTYITSTSSSNALANNYTMAGEF